MVEIKRRRLFLSLLLASALALLCACGGNMPAATLPDAFASPETVPPETAAPKPIATPSPPTPQPTETPEPAPEPVPPLIPLEEIEKSEFVRVLDYVPNIVVELKYATEDNFTGQRIYPFSDQEAWLRCGTVQKLIEAEAKAEEAGYFIKIWDAYRPSSAQFRLWEVYPDPVYVADPYKNGSAHSRGNTMDITIVYQDGSEVTMPTGFDDFSLKADRDYSDCTEEERENAMFLQKIMTECGFDPYSGEWWHFYDLDTYPMADFEPPVSESFEVELGEASKNFARAVETAEVPIPSRPPM